MYNKKHRLTSLTKPQSKLIKKENETKSQITGFYNYKK